MTTRTMLRLAMAMGAAFASPSEAQECRECHLGPDANAPRVTDVSISAHGELECEDCHPAVKTPCEKNMRVAQCKVCHSDEASALAGSTHGEKIRKKLESAGHTKLTASCMSCHGKDTHGIQRVVDPAAPNSRENISLTCLKCHETEQRIAVSGYLESVHGRAVSSGKTKAAECVDCHGSHAIDHSQLPVSSVFHAAIPETCGRCHPREKKEYEASIHWEAARSGFREPPVCTDCHGEHTIRSSQDTSSSTWKGNVTKTCAACHASAKLNAKFMLESDRVKSFEDSFHGLSGELGDTRVADCSSCHGNHMILPSSDSRSTIYPANLGKTCGNCHEGATSLYANAKVHTSTEHPPHWSVRFARAIYIWLIPLTIGAMALHNLLDLVWKSRKGLPYDREPEPFPSRFSAGERVQHATLALSFTVLALSGFALKFPDSPFAWPFQIFSSGASLRRWAHRGSAAVFLALAICHVLYLVLSARGRTQARALWPGKGDAMDVARVIRKYVGLSEAPLRLPRFAYMEKAEYWAVVWGGIVMTVTGSILFFVNASLSTLPYWAVDLARTVHYLEALLAVLAILVWHGYWVVFDPDFYPMNLTWLYGNPRRGGGPAGHGTK